MSDEPRMKMARQIAREPRKLDLPLDVKCRKGTVTLTARVEDGTEEEAAPGRDKEQGIVRTT